VTSIENALAEAAEKQLRELTDLQLAFVGGGIATPIFG
jgi:hypothetical protein